MKTMSWFRRDESVPRPDPASGAGPRGGLRERWRAYTGDRDLELAIRAALRSEGYLGNAARILDARLVAVQRPGWLQVYSFFVEAQDEQRRPHALWGVARVDERRRNDVALFGAERDRDERVGEWARGLTRMHRRERSALEWLLVAGFLAALALAVVSSLSG